MTDALMFLISAGLFIGFLVAALWTGHRAMHRRQAQEFAQLRLAAVRRAREQENELLSAGIFPFEEQIRHDREASTGERDFEPEGE